MNINDLLILIPESPDHSDEALAAIESITTYPAENRLRVRCYMTHEFWLFVSIVDSIICIGAENWNPVVCNKSGFLSALRRVIHEIDEAISEGNYQQKQPSPMSCFVFPSQPPADMDIPVWDDARHEWYDAEY